MQHGHRAGVAPRRGRRRGNRADRISRDAAREQRRHAARMAIGQLQSQPLNDGRRSRIARHDAVPVLERAGDRSVAALECRSQIARQLAFGERECVHLHVCKVLDVVAAARSEQLGDAVGAIRRCELRAQRERIAVAVHFVVGGPDDRTPRGCDAGQQREGNQRIAFAQIVCRMNPPSANRIVRNFAGQMIGDAAARVGELEVLRWTGERRECGCSLFDRSRTIEA